MPRVSATAPAVVDFGPAAALDDVQTFTHAAWIYPKSAGGGGFGRLLGKGSNLFYAEATNTFGNDWNRATTNALSEAADNTLTMNAWNFVAATWDGGTSAIKLYHALPGNLVTEVTYKLQQLGSGLITSDAADNFLMGKRAAGDRAFDGRIANFHLLNFVANQNQLNAIMYGMAHRATPTGLLLSAPLWGLHSPEIDLSSNHGTGTVTGTSLANGPPVTLFTPKITAWVEAAGTVVTPSALAASAAVVDPTVVLGGIAVAPAAIEAAAGAVDPTVLNALSVSPSPIEPNGRVAGPA